MGVMTSRFAGICKSCGGGIAEGEQINYLGKGKGAEHVVCPATPPPPPPPRLATPGQLGFIRDLDGDVEFAKELTMDNASAYIDELKAHKKHVTMTGSKFEEVVDGHYALEHPEDDLNPIRFYRVNTSKRTGYRFLDRYSSDNRFGVSGKEREAVMQRIAEDPLAAATLYGRESNRCCKCNRKLTRRLSRELGIGPVCGENAGWLSREAIMGARARIAARGLNPDEEIDERDV